MEKRVLLAVFLSFLVLYFYQMLFVRPQPKQAPAGQARQQPRPAPASPPGATPQPPPIPEAGARPEALVAADVERDVLVETDTIAAVLSNRGATLKSWKLKHFLDEQGRPLELVPRLPGQQIRPLSLRTDDPELTRRLNDALFRQVSADRPASQAGPPEIVFEYQDAAGLRARKAFRFEPKSYIVTFRAEVLDGDRQIHPTVEWGPALGDVASLSTSSSFASYTQAPEAIFYRDGSIERLGPSTLIEQPVFEGDFRFAGVDDHYFLAAAILPGRVRIEYRPVAAPPASAESDPPPFVAYSARFTRPDAEARFFFGPKDFDVLAAIDRDLVRAINFGWFSWLVVPLLRSLKWINGYVGNYGWSIIILTVLINAAMFPLRHKSVVSMRRMQELQPEVKAIQDRYAKLKTTDPARQKMNVELMNLYRERGVNPASGCVPMLLTMPVLFAFYSLLSVAIEIRGAPFALWIRDLSTHDPLYVTPILMGGTMVWQQAVTPSTADPVQQKMMMVMPVVFTFMFLWAPSGLVIYWLVSNVWAIGQQYLTNRLIGPPVVKAVRPPAERRLKRVGGGKTEGAS